MEFCWNEQKAKINLQKHGVSFEQAKDVFYDKYSRLIADDEHSDEEDRFILIGLSLVAKVLVVSHCYREPDGVVRIISARKANKTEEKQYWRFRQ